MLCLLLDPPGLNFWIYFAAANVCTAESLSCFISISFIDFMYLEMIQRYVRDLSYKPNIYMS